MNHELDEMMGKDVVVAFHRGEHDEAYHTGILVAFTEGNGGPGIISLQVGQGIVNLRVIEGFTDVNLMLPIQDLPNVA